MSGLFESVGKQVGRDGCLKFGERRFWSPDSAKFAGRWVSVRRPGAEDQMVTFWEGDEETARKFAAHLIADAGFSDADVARAAAAQLRDIRTRLQHRDAESALIVGRKITALVQLIDDRIERARKVEPIFGSGLLAGLLERVFKVFQHRRPPPVQCAEHGELDLHRQLTVELGLSDRIFEQALAVFDVPDTMFERIKSHIGFGQGQSPAADAGETSEAESGPHRLCGGAK